MQYIIGEKIREELIKQQRTVSWFAKQINCSRTNVYKIFGKDNLDLKLLFRICQILNHDFFRDISETANFENADKNPLS